MSIIINCPTCSKEIEYSLENPFRPFCSERCRILDLGAWANAEYALSAQPETEEEFEELVQALEMEYTK